MPKVSIITAAYNHEKFIAQAIESVLSQTMTDWELLIWDDGSKDSTLELALAYAAKHPKKIKVFTHSGRGNKGQEITRNCALERAEGNYICLLDSDDFFEPKKLQILADVLDQDATVGLAYGKALLFDDAKQKGAGFSSDHYYSGDVLQRLLKDNFISASAVLFRRDCLNEGLAFDSRFRTCGEYPLWLRMAADWKFIFVDEHVSSWRYHGRNTGSQHVVLAKKELVDLLESLTLDDSFIRFSQFVRESLFQKRYDYINELYFAGQFQEARAEWKKLKIENVGINPSSGQQSKIFLLGILLNYCPDSFNVVSAKLKRKLWSLKKFNAPMKSEF